MTKISGMRNLTAMLAVVAMGAVFSVAAGQARAGDDVTEDQIVRALAPAKKPLTRSLSVGPQADPAAVAAEGKFVQTIRNRTTRSLSAGEREEIATIAKDKPNIDLEINFDYNSADISAKSLPSVQALGRALINPDLKGSTFLVAGYTDAAGGEAYNQDLSERRAEFDQAFSGRQIRYRRHRPCDRRIWQDQAQGSEPTDGGSEPPGTGRQHDEQGHRLEVRSVVAQAGFCRYSASRPLAGRRSWRSPA